MILATLAVGTGSCSPNVPKVPEPVTMTAACPCSGHGRVNVPPPMVKDDASASSERTGSGSGRTNWTTRATTARSATTGAHILTLRRPRPRRRPWGPCPARVRLPRRPVRCPHPVRRGRSRRWARARTRPAFWCLVLRRAGAFGGCRPGLRAGRYGLFARLRAVSLRNRFDALVRCRFVPLGLRCRADGLRRGGLLRLLRFLGRLCRVRLLWRPCPGPLLRPLSAVLADRVRARVMCRAGGLRRRVVLVQDAGVGSSIPHRSLLSTRSRHMRPTGRADGHVTRPDTDAGGGSRRAVRAPPRGPVGDRHAAARPA